MKKATKRSVRKWKEKRQLVSRRGKQQSSRINAVGKKGLSSKGKEAKIWMGKRKVGRAKC